MAQTVYLDLALHNVVACIMGECDYDKTIKEAASYLYDLGADFIWLQCLANGNLDMSQDVLKEAQLHYEQYKLEKWSNG